MRIHPSSLLRPWRPLGLIPVLFCLSCSGGNYNSVHGKVIYKDEPLEGVMVTFIPTGKDKATDFPHGVTGEDGSFTVKTGKEEGAPAGDYVVTLFSPEVNSAKTAKPRGTRLMREFQDRFKGAYSEPAKSPFKVSIKSGNNELEPFNLK